MGKQLKFRDVTGGFLAKWRRGMTNEPQEFHTDDVSLPLPG